MPIGIIDARICDAIKPLGTHGQHVSTTGLGGGQDKRPAILQKLNWQQMRVREDMLFWELPRRLCDRLGRMA
jgi:hypothetical protein